VLLLPTAAAAAAANCCCCQPLLLLLLLLLLLQLADVPSTALSDAAMLAAALLGNSCSEHVSWQAAKGYMVLGEAAARVQVREVEGVCRD
jgi:hypothetical protein